MKNISSMLHSEDAEVESIFKKTYVYKLFLKGDHLKISSREGAVTLSGKVLHEAHKMMAQDTANALPGVRSVDNRIEVTGEEAPVNSDRWIAIKVKLALLYHRSVSGFSTEVFVKDGNVTLKGVAGSTAQKDLTTEYALDIVGVESINNELSISKNEIPKEDDRTSNQIIDDASITSQVKGTLRVHRSTSILRPDVETEEGEVTLTGFAKNLAEKDLVTKLIGDIHGVRSVNNTMTISKGNNAL
ncbi:MAG: BON domain-containing protein [Candidatus Wallbacteria bacterium]|nr:BON domain-containing protein [Candidatus Wallbacteria bacterium]